MYLTRPQTFTFWKQWHTIKTHYAWTPEEAETQRHALIQRAGIPSGSLKDVDKLKGFDKVLAELSALSHPNDLKSQLRQVQMPRTRLQFKITELSAKLSPAHFKLAYAVKLAQDRFATADLESLSDHQLEQLRNTLADRLVQEHRVATKEYRSSINARRRATRPPPARPVFPATDLPTSTDQQIAA